MFGLRYTYVRKWFVLAVATGLAGVGLVLALQGKHFATRRGEEKPRIAKNTGVAVDSESGWNEDNVRAVQQELGDGSFYSGEIDGAYSSELALALTRYQIRNGLPITGRLDVDTSEALGAKPAVTTTADNHAQSSETWRRLRAGDQQARNARVVQSPPIDQTPRTTSIATTMREEAAAIGTIPSDGTKPASAPITASDSSSTAREYSTEGLRDYVGAFVLAGLDPHVGAEADFFADRVHYYDQGTLSREKIRKDLKRYAERWPKRRFWLAGDITVEPQNDNRVRVRFPLRYELRNGGKHSSGKIDKTLVLEPSGHDLEIIAVNERKAH